MVADTAQNPMVVIAQTHHFMEAVAEDMASKDLLHTEVRRQAIRAWHMCWCP